MSKRDKRAALGLGGAEGIDTGAAMTVEELARAGYSLPDLSSVDSGRIVSRPLDIFKIVPDSAQPRRAVPSSIRQHWDGNPENVGVMFEVWVNAFAEETGIDWQDALDRIRNLLVGQQLEAGDYDTLPETKRHKGPAEVGLMAVIELAAGIRRDGLLNPITVVKLDGGWWQIETGERRWLAHHLLVWMLAGNQFSKIPAREVKGVNVWAQATENTARSPLTAIGKARQMAILLMDLYTAEGATFQPYEAFTHDRHYYAQVADGYQWRTPEGKGEMLLTAMALDNPVQIRQYRALLRLPDAVWTLADDFNLSENWLREAQRQSVSEGMFLNMCLMEAADQGYIVTGVTIPTPNGGELDGDDVDQDAAWDGEEDAIFEPDPADEGDEPETPTPPTASGNNGSHTPGTPPQSPSSRSLSEQHDRWANGDSEPETPPTPAPEMALLKWAYKHALTDLRRTGWFAGTQTPSIPVATLNAYVERGWLEAKPGNGKLAGNAFFRIAPEGCKRIGQPVVEYTPGQGSITPEEAQARLERGINNQLKELLAQIRFSGPRVPVEQIKTADGQTEAGEHIDQMETAITTLRKRLGLG